MNRMGQYGASELHFSLMALTRDRVELYEEQIEEVDGMLLSLPEDSPERTQLNGDRAMIEHKLQLEKEKRVRWHVSNIKWKEATHVPDTQASCRERTSCASTILSL